MISFQNLPAGAMPREALDFYSALNACENITTQPHPVQARNCGILPAWRLWTDKYPATSNADLTKNYLSKLYHRFEDNVMVCQDVILSHLNNLSCLASAPMSHDTVDIVSKLATAAMMFWARPHAIIDATDALENLLIHSDLGDDLPIGLIRPPYPACYIKFGKAFRDSVDTTADHEPLPPYRLQGVYVFEAARDTQRALSFIPIVEFDDISQLSSGGLEMIIDDEAQSTNQCIGRLFNASHSGQLAHFQGIVHICTKIFLYMNASQSVQLDDLSYTLAEKQLSGYGPKKFAKRKRQIAHLYDRILIGPQTIAQHEIGAHGEHSEVAPHMRRGHFRLQPHGPQQSLRKVIFIAPTWIRADRL